MKDLFQIDSNDIQSVSELTKEIKNHLEPNFRSLWVKGEISNLRSQKSGHIYFSLKDAQSQIPCVFFSRYSSNSECLLEDGAEIFVFGDLTIYEPYGRYQFNVKLAQSSGKGHLHILFEKLKKKLYDEGLFDSSHKQPIPKIPKKIALITSPTGAAIQDFLRILKRRKFFGTIDLLPTQVQGKQAHIEMMKAIEYASKKEHAYDLIILMRGGGSIEDLWSFNEESLARSLFKSTIPSISAIGHEIDTVLTDLVSDFRAETPSAAAELISSNFIETKNTYIKYSEFLIKQKTDAIFYLKEHLSNTSKKLALLKPQNLIDKKMMHLDVLEKKLSQKLNMAIQLKNESVSKFLSKLSQHHPSQKLKANVSRLKIRQHQFIQLKNAPLKTKSTDLSNLKHRLDNSSIQSSLKRGYVLLKNENQKVLSSYQDAKKESIFHVQFHDGDLKMKKNP